MNIEFIKYEESKNEYQLGIATIRYEGIVLRYKIVSRKEGVGYFPAVASYKVDREGQPEYLKAFVVDSRSVEEEIENTIREGVRKHMTQAPTQSSEWNSEIPF